MEKGDLFGCLVRYHTELNLETCLKYVKEGRIVDGDNLPLKEGSDKKTHYDGLLIVANGDTLVNRLKEDTVIHDESIGAFVDIREEKDLTKYFLEQEDSDGAYVFDGVNSRITLVDELNNNIDLPEGVHFSDMIPSDFTHSDANTQSLGTKTRLAIKVPHAYKNTEAFQIKRSAYTSFGMGKVTHFNSQGLVEEAFFTFDPEKETKNIRENIYLIYRKYERKNNKLEKISEEKIALKDVNSYFAK
ncbi:hypothetical protein HY837_01855 [archaeon]|nr:hypothetical protein [archaeon]